MAYDQQVRIGEKVRISIFLTWVMYPKPKAENIRKKLLFVWNKKYTIFPFTSKFYYHSNYHHTSSSLASLFVCLFFSSRLKAYYAEQSNHLYEYVVIEVNFCTLLYFYTGEYKMRSEVRKFFIKANYSPVAMFSITQILYECKNIVIQ